MIWSVLPVFKILGKQTHPRSCFFYLVCLGCGSGVSFFSAASYSTIRIFYNVFVHFWLVSRSGMLCAAVTFLGVSPGAHRLECVSDVYLAVESLGREWRCSALSAD